jgi:iron uptake system component EfeO
MTVSSLLMTYAPARRLLRPPLLALLAAALAASVVSGCGSGGAPAATGVISFNTNSCGVGWTHPAAGLQTLRLYNGATAGGEVDLIDPATGAVYA